MNFPWPKSVSIRRVLYLRRCAGNRSKHRYGAFARNIFYSSPNCRARPYGIGLKEYGVLLFCKGALINDANGILFKPGENMRAARQIRFTNVRGKVELETILKSYTYEAVEAEKAGWKVNFKRNSELLLPEEFQNKLDENPSLKTAFGVLTPGRRREYILDISGPK